MHGDYRRTGYRPLYVMSGTSERPQKEQKQKQTEEHCRVGHQTGERIKRTVVTDTYI